VEGTIPIVVRTIPHLTLVPGGLADFGRVGGVAVALATPDDPVFTRVTRVVEEDTHLVLSAPAWIPDEPVPPTLRILEDVARFEPRSVGTVVDHGARILAVVHDLALEPSTCPAWIDDAVAAALDVAARRGLARLAFEPLGTVHARLSVRHVLSALVRALDRRAHPSLLEVGVLVPLGLRDAAERTLGGLLADRGHPG
jgi:hypothetical protein